MLDRASDAPRVVERVPGMYVSQKQPSVVSAPRLPETPLGPKISVLGRHVGFRGIPYWTGEPTMGSFAVRIVGAYRTRSVLTASRCATRREGGSRVAGSRITVSRLGGRSAIRAERESGFSPKVGSRRYLLEGFRAEGRR